MLWSHWLGVNERWIDESLVRLHSAVRRLDADVHRVADLEARRREILDAASRQKAQSAPDLSTVLRELGIAMPVEARLQGLTLHDGRLRLEGQALSLGTVAALLERLDKAPSLGGPAELVESRRSREVPLAHVRFVVQAHVRRR